MSSTIPLVVIIGAVILASAVVAIVIFAIISKIRK